MKKELEQFYENFDNKMKKIQRKIKRKDSKDKRQPIIFNFDEVPFWYYKKP